MQVRWCLPLICAAPPAPEASIPLQAVEQAAHCTCHGVSQSRLEVGAAGLTIDTGLGTLEVEDLLVGHKCEAYRFLACSFPATGKEGSSVRWRSLQGSACVHGDGC